VSAGYVWKNVSRCDVSGGDVNAGDVSVREGRYE